MDNNTIIKVTQMVKDLLTENIDNCDTISMLIDKYLIPKDLDKKKNAEISTPYKLRQEMLDKIPSDFWTQPHKVLEPCSGKGGFLIDIIGKFMNGLPHLYPNPEERYQFIVEECLYWCDINPQNIYICKSLIDPHNQYTLNYYEGNTLELNINHIWNLVGFDAVICNPPYQAVAKSGVSTGGGNNLYTKFIYYADKKLLTNGYLLFINPPSYFGPKRFNSISVRVEILNNYYYHYINLEECSKYFNIGSKFIYYLFQKKKEINKALPVVCKYQKKIYNTIINQELLVNMDYLPYLLTEECLHILAKIKNDTNKKLKIFHSPDNRVDKKHILKMNKIETFEDYQERAKEAGYIYPIQSTGSQVIFSSKRCKNQYDKKVLMSESGYLKPFYDDGIKGVGGHSLACLVKDNIEGDYIIKLLNSKVYRFYIQVNKWYGFHDRKVLQDLPYIKLNDLDETTIYNYFNISDNEINLIESSLV